MKTIEQVKEEIKNKYKFTDSDVENIVYTIFILRNISYKKFVIKYISAKPNKK